MTSVLSAIAYYDVMAIFDAYHIAHTELVLMVTCMHGRVSILLWCKMALTQVYEGKSELCS